MRNARPSYQDNERFSNQIQKEMINLLYHFPFGNSRGRKENDMKFNERKFNRLINRLKCVFIADETVLDKHNRFHWGLVEGMQDALYEIWEYSKIGNVLACGFMHSKLRERLVQFRLDFMNDDIPSLHKRATYGAYKDIMIEVVSLLHVLRKERVALTEMKRGGAA